ncbi:metal-sensing transcriptional repressor [Mucilaginibacter gossypii]|uniref:metal-sensing transcriptional repressor n=1 Tax=Mucilaginibacter gossypii TaxID=551996 RepID=UPI000DCEE52D|nr:MULTISPECIES: metal-sensing transcriptional repressor [Mucilaginibacter]QTE35827.1 metal-sensing transcriptional repressor [Mucilaginibacter gossypii]RAV54632.1 metal-sensitive transcriptional regulator [Mucilaginibacter rubeus]
MLQKDLTRDIKTRLNTVKGQLEGIVKMLDDDKDPEHILNQFKAAGKALLMAEELLLDETYRKSLAAKISETLQACPGNCGQEDIIEMLRMQFPTLEQNQLTKKMKEIQAAYDQMQKNKQEKLKTFGDHPTPQR